VVEDDDDIRDYLNICLTDEGHEVLVSYSLESAFSEVDSDFRPDLLLTDFNLQGVFDGADIACRLRNEYPQVPVLMISGQPKSACEKIDLKNNAVLLSKPFVRHELLSAIRRLAILPADGTAPQQSS